MLTACCHGEEMLTLLLCSPTPLTIENVPSVTMDCAFQTVLPSTPEKFTHPEQVVESTQRGYSLLCFPYL